jgi:hypothetical protein
LASRVQLVPSQVSIGASLASPSLDHPTATHAVALVQANPLSPSKPFTFGVVAVVQEVPFHESISVVAVVALTYGDMVLPTARQKLAFTHETLLNVLRGPGEGLDVIDQDVPSQVSIRVVSVLEFEASPTATQSDELRQVTPSRLPPNPVGVGLGATDHVVPFQVSTNVANVSVASTIECPTATQKEEVMHETSDRMFS